MRGEVIRIDTDSPDPLLVESVVACLEEGNVVIHPTETVYGFAGYIFEEIALQKIIRLKSRKISQPFSIMVNSTEEMISLSGQYNTKLNMFLDQLFPAAVTILLPRKKKLALEYWNQFPYLGFRFPKHRLCNMMLKLSTQPLITTSANLTGDTAPIEFIEIFKDILNHVPLIIDGGITYYKMASTVIRFDEKAEKLKLVREGAVPWSEIQKRFESID